MKSDSDMINQVAVRAKRKAFLEPIIYEDTFDDWELARRFGEFVVGQDSSLVMGHALLARACRHLGEMSRARAELEECRRLAPYPSEREMFQSFISEEEQKLTQGGW